MSAMIRNANPDDLGTVAFMLQQLGHHVGYKPKVTAEDLMAFGPHGRGDFTILVAEVEGNILGILLYSIVFSAWRGRPGIYVSDIFVADAARGLGLGTQLMRAAIAGELPRGAAYLKLEVDRKNETGLGFYEKRGFRRSDSDHTMVMEEAMMRQL
ncbi:GNAT family N-acetyltransferase [Microvirga solisilvae]|uniref:GNAT family N-acetyltransferase n=1 Tax=Microvirga solisilvae TaxID=2919498 RepID=UPI001FAFA1F3|nr:GNAT family N-acetyltransferase [Microvirga solisilvae]